MKCESKHLWEIMKISTYESEVSTCGKKTPHASAFRHQYKPQKQFANSGS